jgi:acyl-CoA dehydrogenase
MQAIEADDAEGFDRAFFEHLNLFARNATRSLFLGLTGGRLARPPVAGNEARHYRSLTRFSASFALIADAALAMLGGDLKRREKLSGRMADALAWLYLGSTALKRFHDDGRPERDAAVLEWVCGHAAWQVQEALDGVLANLPNRAAAALLARFVFPWGRPASPPKDSVGARVAQALLNDGELRQRLSRDIFVPANSDRGLGRLEAALRKIVAAEGINQKLRQAVRNGAVDRYPVESLAARARQANLIDPTEMCLVAEAEVARDAAISVDAFAPQAYLELRG